MPRSASKSPRSVSSFLGLAALATTVVSLPVEVAAAQDSTGRPNANRFYAATGRGFIGVDGAEVVGNLQPSFLLNFNYAHRPFAVDDTDYYTGQAASPSCQSGSTGPCQELDLVSGTATAELAGSIAIADRLQISLNIPFIAYTEGRGTSWTEVGSSGQSVPRFVPSGTGTMLGDPRLHALVNIMDPRQSNGVSFGIAGWVTAPIARLQLPDRYAGDPSVAVGGHIIFGVQVERFRAAINVGGAFHDRQQIFFSRRGAEMTWGVAAHYEFDAAWGLMAEAQGATTFGLDFDNEAPTELRGALTLRTGDVSFQLGGGAGVFYGIGVPVFRAFGQVAYNPRPVLDTDHDGIPDDLDACPAEREDMDNWNDEDGCPDPDNDHDGIPDSSDRCANEAEDVDEFEDTDGCPDNDDDQDGVTDGYDSCPREPEDRDGDRDDDGCPDNDRDRDNIPDDVDQCPDAPEDTDGLGDEDGCPDEDFDQDGVPDVEDECPEEAEDRDGFEDANGCPEEGSLPTGRTGIRAR